MPRSNASGPRGSGPRKRHGAPRSPVAARAGSGDPGVEARRLAIDALLRIDTDGAYANLVLPPMLERSGLEARDRGLVTELVYGTTRMRRALDFIVDRFLLDEVDPAVRAALRLGAYQLHMMGTPAHAAVGATVGAAGGRARGLVNAVLRKVAAERGAMDESWDAPAIPWPNEATRLSYPDWIAEQLIADLGHDRAIAAMESMNEAAAVHQRDDGYVQDPASQYVAAAVDVRPGQRVIDLCAAPGGKATLLALDGALVVASDLRPNRTRLIARNVARLADRAAAAGNPVSPALGVITADATAPPFAPETFDRVLVDAPCSGLGSLRRRADARWRIEADAPDRLAALQTRIVAAGVDLLVPGGELVYSVCTLTRTETHGVLEVIRARSDIEVLDPPDDPWQSDGDVAFLLPGETDGMSIFRLRKRVT